MDIQAKNKHYIKQMKSRGFENIRFSVLKTNGRMERLFEQPPQPYVPV